MKLTILILFMLIVSSKVNAQSVDLYKKYKNEEFLKIKTIDKGHDYIKTIYKRININVDYQENKADKTFKILLINNADNNDIEVIPVNVPDNFRKEIIKVFKIANKIFLKKDTEKYITEFKITLDYEPHRKERYWKKLYPEIMLFLYKTETQKIIMDCTDMGSEIK